MSNKNAVIPEMKKKFNSWFRKTLFVIIVNLFLISYYDSIQI